MLIQPSLIEGFGLPPVEAMACGTAVVVSRVGSLPEVVGNAGVYCDPLDVADIRTAINRVLTNLDLRQRLIAAGISRASLFRWDDVAKKVADVLGLKSSLSAFTLTSSCTQSSKGVAT